MVRCTSESPPLEPSARWPPMESTSSMKIREGALSLRQGAETARERGHGTANYALPQRAARPTTHRAITKSSRTMRAPSPMYFCTSSEPETRMKVQSVWWATARASRVLPVPGGP